MNRTKVLENSECRRLFAMFWILAVFLAFGITLICFFSVSNIETHLMQRESAVAGKLINSGAANTGDIINAFASGDKAADVETGEQALNTAGYGKDTADVFLPFLYGDTVQYFSLIIVAVLFVFVLFMVLTYISLLKVFKKVEEAGSKAILISRGNYDTKLKEDSEGAFARMNHAFNEMSVGVNAGFERQKSQRVFLKNLISDISHQLKTPLAALKMYNEITLQEQISDTARDFTKKSEEQLERMEWLILGLLKMARVEAGCLEFDLQQNDVTSIAKEACEDFTMAMKEKNISLVFKSEDNPGILCDYGWLKEAIGNVIKNCAEYTPEGGQITVEVWQTPVVVSVKISDTGRGIHPDDLPNIFRRFYRGHRSQGAGSGIGLALAKSIVEQMGGTLSAGGEYGRGAVFTFSFLKQVI